MLFKLKMLRYFQNNILTFLITILTQFFTTLFLHFAPGLLFGCGWCHLGMDFVSGGLKEII
jgi:hypothetical protein